MTFQMSIKNRQKIIESFKIIEFIIIAPIALFPDFIKDASQFPILSSSLHVESSRLAGIGP
jgi:hypothetical protein